MLTKDAMYQISDYLSNNELTQLSSFASTTGDSNTTLAIKVLKDQRDFKERYFQKLHQHRLTKYFSDPIVKNMTKFPYLPFQERFIGGTAYLDSIRIQDLSSPVMIGYDKYQRPYITLKYRCHEKSYQQNSDTVEIDTDKISCITIFQRYTDVPNRWCKAGRYLSSEDPILNCSPILLSSLDLKLFIKNIYLMLSDQPIYYINYHNKHNDGYKLSTLKCSLAF